MWLGCPFILPELYPTGEAGMAATATGHREVQLQGITSLCSSRYTCVPWLLPLPLLPPPSRHFRYAATRRSTHFNICPPAGWPTAYMYTARCCHLIATVIGLLVAVTTVTKVLVLRRRRCQDVPRDRSLRGGGGGLGGGAAVHAGGGGAPLLIQATVTNPRYHVVKVMEIGGCCHLSLLWLGSFLHRVQTPKGAFLEEPTIDVVDYVIWGIPPPQSNP